MDQKTEYSTAYRISTLLVHLFGTSERMLAFLRSATGTEDLCRELPSAAVPAEDMAFAIAMRLMEHGFVNQRLFLDLIKRRPNHGALIQSVAEECGISVEKPVAPAAVKFPQPDRRIHPALVLMPFAGTVLAIALILQPFLENGSLTPFSDSKDTPNPQPLEPDGVLEYRDQTRLFVDGPLKTRTLEEALPNSNLRLDGPKKTSSTASRDPTPAKWFGKQDERCPADMMLVSSSEATQSPKPFCIDKHEVAVAEYAECALTSDCSEAAAEVSWEEGSSKSRSIYSSECNIRHIDRSKHPINCITWNQAMKFCGWKGSRNGQAGRLPTIEEWTLAASGKFAWGDEPEPALGYLNACGTECWNWVVTTQPEKVSSAPDVLYTKSDGWPTTAPVGSFKKDVSKTSQLFDMAGNVSEWVAGEKVGAHSFVGGSWRYFSPSNVTTRFQREVHATFADSRVGFRCAWSLAQ